MKLLLQKHWKEEENYRNTKRDIIVLFIFYIEAAIIAILSPSAIKKVAKIFKSSVLNSLPIITVREFARAIKFQPEQLLEFKNVQKRTGTKCTKCAK